MSRACIRVDRFFCRTHHERRPRQKTTRNNTHHGRRHRRLQDDTVARLTGRHHQPVALLLGPPPHCALRRAPSNFRLPQATGLTCDHGGRQVYPQESTPRLFPPEVGAPVSSTARPPPAPALLIELYSERASGGADQMPPPGEGIRTGSGAGTSTQCFLFSPSLERWPAPARVFLISARAHLRLKA